MPQNLFSKCLFFIDEYAKQPHLELNFANDSLLFARIEQEEKESWRLLTGAEDSSEWNIKTSVLSSIYGIARNVIQCDICGAVSIRNASDLMPFYVSCEPSTC